MPHQTRRSPTTYDIIIVMGKTYAPGQEPAQLRARAALGVLLWRQSSGELPFACLEGYDHPDKTRSGADVVGQVAQWAGLPVSRLHLRPVANCTALEVEAIRDLLTELQCRAPLVITHPYHLRRVRHYLHSVGVHAQVIGCSPWVAQSLPSATHAPDLLKLIVTGEPALSNQLSEALFETVLYWLHQADPAGHIERWLANRVRGTGTIPASQPASTPGTVASQFDRIDS